MVGNRKGFISLAKQENKEIVTTHCFLHREALISKTLPSELKEVLDEVVRMINFVKTRHRVTQILSNLCQEMDSDYLTLLSHTDVRWLSRGKSLERVYKLKDELVQCFAKEGKANFVELLKNKKWSAKLAYLVDIFGHLNKTNVAMQGKKENLLSSHDKIKALSEKIEAWGKRIVVGRFEMFLFFVRKKDLN